MNEKTYIECRVFILGEKNVGKKSFICRILNLPSTSEIRNLEEEENFKNNIIKLTKKIEEEEKFFIESEKDNKEQLKKSRNDLLLKKKKNYNMSNTVSDMSENNKLFSSNLNIGTENRFKIIFPPKIENSRIYHRPPFPEYPSKLFNIFQTKIVFKPYFISPAEDLPYDYIPKDDEDSDYEFEKEYKLSMKGIKNEIEKIMNLKKTVIDYEKINGYKINIYYFFLLLYDMSNYSSFESIIKYYNNLEKKYNISEDENLITCVIGNKKDKKIQFTEEQNKKINDFISKNNLNNYEISTKPFFNFSKFFVELIKENIGSLHEYLFKGNNFENELKKLIENKSNFPKAIRSSFFPNVDNPGPDYDLNIYGFNSMKELKEGLINKRTRFTRKIFVNKQGPLISKSKSTKDLLSFEDKKEKNLLYISQGGILNKPISGYTFGILKGKLNLIKSRKDLYLERNKSLMESIEGDNSLNLKHSNAKIKNEEYFIEAEKRKNKIQKERINERKLKLDKIAKIHQNNLNKIASEKDLQNDIINQKMNKSTSSPNLFNNSLNNNYQNENNEELNYNKQRYYDVIYNKNKDYMDKFNVRKIKIEKEKIKEEKKRNKEIEREKQKEEELKRERIRERERKEKLKYKNINSHSVIGRSVFGRYSIIKEGPSFPDFKDEFEIMAEKNLKRYNIKRQFKPRFKEIEKEKEQIPYNDQEIWKRWELNRENIKENGHLKMFLDYCKQKENAHYENMKKIEAQNNEIKQIRREILIKKGYDDPSELRTINYSLVEESSPKYSIKGKNMPKTKINEDIGNILLGQNMEMIEYVRNLQLNSPLPNINYVKPNYPSVIFNKAERFENYNKPYEGSLDLFKDGIFAPKTQEDFLSKGTFTQNEKSLINKNENNNNNSPGPCQYKIKSSFDKIVEEGKKISEIRKKIKINNEIENERRKKNLDFEVEKKDEKKLDLTNDIEKADNI